MIGTEVAFISNKCISGTKYTCVFVLFQPHKYIIEAQVLKDSWPLSEASWAFVQMLKELEKNELKGT